MTTRKTTILTFYFNSQDRQWTEVHEGYNAEVIEPLKQDSTPQEGNYPITIVILLEVHYKLCTQTTQGKEMDGIKPSRKISRTSLIMAHY
jgi:hypothetical protein